MKEKILKKENIIHIAIIVIGAILLIIPAFHSNIWFDEAYSVGIVEHSFSEIWTIGSHDVHPILYYWMLKIVNIIFGTNIIAYRLFSVLGIVVLGILGLTHIKKDFGTKTGLLFTFFSMFLPAILNYALEIRMYSWTITFVTLMTIYLYRFIKHKDLKNLVLFGIFSVTSCYMHYYALVCAGITNLGLIIYVIKNRKELGKDLLTKFFIVEAMQVLIYTPWLIVFIRQMMGVGGGFWITIQFPQILIDLINFQFKGNLQETVPTIFATILMIYVIYLIIKNIKKKEDIKPGIIPLVIYLFVIIAMAIFSIISPILYPRYLFTITGLLIFTISYFLIKEDNKFAIGAICGIVIVFSLMNSISLKEENYDQSNNKAIEYLREELKPDDIIVYSGINEGGVVAALIDTNKQYFLNVEDWGIEEAYKAFAPQMGVVNNFEEAAQKAKGRIFVVNSDNLNLEENTQYKVVSDEKFETKFKNYTYKIKILEKVQ